MLSKIGKTKFHIESYVCDFNEKATITVVARLMLDAASIHAQERDFGYEHLLRDNVTWVMSRLSIQLDEYPGHNEYFTVETWVEAVNRTFTQRCFRFTNQSGKIIGYANSIWAAIDLTTRRPIDIVSWRPDMMDFIVEEKICPIEKMSKIPQLDEIESCMGYTVRYSDIDINKHMNSAKYIEHAVNTFDLNIFREKFIHKLDILYLAEGVFGDKVKLYKQSLSEDEYIIDTKKGEESVCRIRIIWK